jgi:hypothetical protein
MAIGDRIVAPFTDLNTGKYNYLGPGWPDKDAKEVEIINGPKGLEVVFNPGFYPTPLCDVHVSGVFLVIDQFNSFEQLCIGDRFQRVDGKKGTLTDECWTKIDNDTARLHSSASIKLGTRGHGYIGDAICSFDPTDKVKFLPVVLP